MAKKGGTKKKIRQQVTRVEIIIVNAKGFAFGSLFTGSSRIRYCGFIKKDYCKIIKLDFYGKPPGQREVEGIKKQIQAAAGGSSERSSSGDNRDTISASVWDSESSTSTMIKNIREATTKRKGW
ncbi:MAG: hypothetical protein NTZ42_02170 [Candidatus Gribaldobacteria bacterium]|nr:hypothetical protein [Candidatus Gribaldobacteria bacterium]